MWKLWLIIAGLFFIVEIITTGFLTFWFGIGAIIAMILSLFVSNIIIQTTIFLISSTILVFLTKPLAQKFFKTDLKKTNAFSIIGKDAIVVKDIKKSSVGQIKIYGEVWTAESENGEEIQKNTNVKIIAIDGVKAIVKRI